MTGLSNGTAYTFTVTATNAVGTGPASAPSSSVVPNAQSASVAQQASSASSGGALTLNGVQAGSTLVAIMYNFGGTLGTSMSDGQGNVWTEVSGTRISNGAASTMVTFVAPNADFRGKEFDPNSGVLKAEAAAAPPGHVGGGDDGLAKDW